MQTFCRATNRPQCACLQMACAARRAAPPCRADQHAFRPKRKLRAPLSVCPAEPSGAYDVIVVGSGNGACGFLSEYMQQRREGADALRVAVVEEGESFFVVSGATHQSNWTRSLAQNNIFRLHNAATPEGQPIISGRACAHGGGGSLNYTMIHESSAWLTQHIGGDERYWDELKEELNAKFQRADPTKSESPMTKAVLSAALGQGYTASAQRTQHIPNFVEPGEGLGDRVLHQFPTQFDSFGNRVHSGVSLVDWDDPRVSLFTQTKVTGLEFEGLDDAGSDARCTRVRLSRVQADGTSVAPLENGLELSERGILVLCAGAATPRLLYGFKGRLGGGAIGQHVNDHVVMPLGIYAVRKSQLPVTRRDVYVPVFATDFVGPVTGAACETSVCFDFFSGDVSNLVYLVSHLYLALVLPNSWKAGLVSNERAFTAVKGAVSRAVECITRAVVWLVPSYEPINIVTATVKFDPLATGEYLAEDERIVLPIFAAGKSGSGNPDKEVARAAIKKNMKMLSDLGDPLPSVVSWLITLLTKIPYTEAQVDAYVDRYASKCLLTEQHMAGGCMFGEALLTGDGNARDTGRLIGAANVHVADLSAVPLPRVSSQMTAYIVGFHVAKRLSL